MIPVNASSLNRWRATLSGMALLLAVLAGGGCGSKQTVADGNAALGEIMGQKTAELLGGHGSVVLLISEPDDTQSAGLEKTIAAYKQGLGKSVQVSAVENLRTRPMPGLPPLSPQQFSDVLQKYPTADALASFVMLPRLTPDEVRQLPSPRPKVVTLAGVPAKNLLTQQVVYLAAVPKPASGTGSQPHTAQEWFDAQYQIVTPQTASLLP